MAKGWLACAIASALSAIGCTDDFYARRILCHATAYGKLQEGLHAGPAKLIAQGRISAHRRIAGVDGIEIDTWVIRSRGDQVRHGQPCGTVVFLHGLLDSKVRFLSLAQRTTERGFDAVLIDARAHGRSGGKYVTWGAKEKHDVKAVVSALLAEGLIREPIFAFGHSMGAATAVMYGAVDERCRGVLAVAPYADARRVSRRFVPLMSDATFDGAWRRAAELGGFDPADASTVAAAGMLTCPLIVVHGNVDPICPHDHGLSVYQACRAPKKIHSLALAGHVSVLLARQRWFVHRIEALAAGLQGPGDVARHAL